VTETTANKFTTNISLNFNEERRIHLPDKVNFKLFYSTSLEIMKFINIVKIVCRSIDDISGKIDGNDV
jgi:hypothetical protein